MVDFPDTKNTQQAVGRIIGANMDTTADQPISITVPPGASGILITGIYAMNASTSLTTAAGGVYSAAAKAGTAIVAAGQVYTALTGSANQYLALTLAVSWRVTATGLIYLALTTGQGATASADLIVVGIPYYA